MTIEKLEIISFGKLKNKTIDFSEGINIIYGDNESGKSTVINFIFAMFYGFGESRTKALSLREKYTPWDGGVCEGKMTLKTDDGKRISIYRKAGSAKKYDTLLIHDTLTGEELPLSPEEIVGVESDTFLKTLLIKQLGSAFDGGNDEIARKLSNISSGGDESVSFEKAQKILDSIRREIQPQRGGGGEYTEISKKISDAQKLLETKRNAEAELSGISPVIAKEEKKIKSIEENISNLSDADYSSAIAHISGRIEEMEKADGKKFLLLPIALFSAFAVTLFINTKYSIILFVLFVISILFSLKTNKSKKSEKDELLKKKSFLVSKKAQSKDNISHLNEELATAKARLMELKIRKETLKIEAEKSSPDIDKLYSEKELMERKLRTISLVSKALTAAHENMQKNFTPLLNEKASAYFSSITDGKYERIFCDKEFGLSIESTIPRESGFFSGGTVDQLYLSLRLALIDMIFGENSCPVILDQPFLQYDAHRTSNALSMFESMKKTRQIILFTANKELSDRKI